MGRIVAAALFFAVSGCATLSAERRAALELDAQPAVLALQAGRFDDAIAQSKSSLTKDPDNARASAVLALSVYRLAMHDLTTDLLTFGSSVMASQIMRGNYINRDFLDFAVNRAEARLAEVDAALARAEEDPGFSLELCLACWEIDWNRNGEVDERDRHLLEIERGRDGELLPENDPLRRPTFRFDWADLYWLRAMVSFQRAALAIVSAYEFRFQPRSLELKLRDAKHMARARELLLTGLEQAQACRRAVLAEIDDDREWLPSPRQKSHAMPLPVDEALFDTWKDVLDDVEKLVRSEAGLPATEVAQLGRRQWEHPPGGYLDVGRLFTAPANLSLPIDSELQRALRRHDGAAVEAGLRQVFGGAWRDSMTPSKLPMRLERMKKEIDRSEDTIERKLRYLLWLN